MTKSLSTLSLLAMASTSVALPSHAQPVARTAVKDKVGYIDVSVATVWTNPGKPRPVDAPSLTNPAEVETWLSSMSVEQYLNLTDDNRSQSQALYGSLVHILDLKDGWYQVAVASEPSPKNELGYPGWVPASQVSIDDGYGSLLRTNPFAMVDKSATGTLYRDIFMKEKFMDISYDTRLPVILNLGIAVQVRVPSAGSAYLHRSDVSLYDTEKDIPYPAKEDLIKTASLFFGKPYLWGGTSGFAFDCSGFTHTIYHGHGITIARDAGPQAVSANQGRSVEKHELQVGDLMFYAHNVSNPDTIHHVAMYIGDGQMVEAFGAGVPVRRTSARLGSEYWGARRYLR